MIYVISDYIYVYIIYDNNVIIIIEFIVFIL